MVLLSVSQVKKMFGASTLFENVSFDVHDGERLALIGNNGTGKSTLFKIILHEEEMTSGNIAFAKGCKIGYLSQDVISSLENTMLEEASLVFKDLIEEGKQLEKIAKRIEQDPHNNELIRTYGNRVTLFEERGGYSFPYKIKMILNKFGFLEDMWNRKISSFSGGERVKMAFAKLLLIEPDLLLLDEPTNHLDVSTIDWLEKYLVNYKGAILFISHDKYFLNRLATSIVEIENYTSTLYKGNFDNYYVLKKQNFERMQKEYNMQQKEIEKMQRFIDYFMPKPRFASRAKDRVKKLEHMVKKEPPKNSKKGISFEFEGASRADKKIIDFKDVSIGYDKEIISPFSFLLFGGDKLCIMGDNGTGKTTLLKCINEEIKPISGKIKRLMPLKIGYIKQNDFDLTSTLSLLDYFNELFPMMGNRDVRNHLGKFGFYGDDVFKEVNVLSGGEMMRVMLAKIVLMSYDILLLDEPTNHLDMITRESLITAMQEFNACIIFVSHDRYFIDAVATRILYFANGTPTLFEGNYSEFKGIEEEIVKNCSDIEEVQEKEVGSAKPTYSNKLSNNAIKKKEEELAEIDARLQEINALYASEDIMEDFFILNDLNKEEKELEEKYEQIYKELYE